MATDFKFVDAGFTATTMDVEPTSEAGREFWQAHGFGEAISATLRKTGGFEMMAAIEKAGLRFEVS